MLTHIQIVLVGLFVIKQAFSEGNVWCAVVVSNEVQLLRYCT